MILVSKSQSGFILIAVLWISLLLSIFALNISTRSRLAGVQAMNIEQMTLQSQALHSGIAKGYHEYRKFSDNRGLFENREESESLTGKQLELWWPGYEPFYFEVGDISVGVRLLDAGGMLNINNVDLERLMEIVDLCGADSGVQTTSIANSILDWIDEDDLERAEGAEKDYYLSLTTQYLPKNSEMQDIRELLMVKGVSREIFYGTSEHPGLSHFFTVQGENQRININTAPPESFAILGDMPPQVIEDILLFRKDEPITNLIDIAEIIPQGYFDLLENYFRADEPGKIEIEAFIVLEDGSPGRSMRKILD